MDQSHPLIKTVLVTGFLGAGKTTLINRLIDWYGDGAEKLAVMINEFGSIGIDGALVKEGDFYKIELNKGSIFCICMRTDFIAELKNIAENLKPDYLIIEATGIARVDDMYAMMRADGLDKLISIERNICVIDAVNFHKVEATLEAVQIQAEYADAFVLNKTDLAGAGRIRETENLLKEHNENAPIFPARFGEISMEALTAAHSNTKTAPGECSDTLPEEFYSFSIELEEPLDRAKWDRFIDNIRKEVLRGKGILRFPKEAVYFEIIGGKYSEKKPVEALLREEVSKIVLIQRAMDYESLEKSVKACTIQGNG